MATVTLGDKNIALALVENGYASVIRHRQGDEDRSPIWDTLLAAEEVAKKEQKGMYSSKVPSKMVEASETIQKAKSYLSFLQRQKKVPAVVDFAASGSRFKVIIPKENARLTFILSGITAPKTARNPSEQSEPFGLEALAYVSKKCLQRDVEVDVEDIDRVGGFIGTMYVNRENVAKGLVEEGFASVHEYSAEKTGHANELFAAESRAKAARKGIWHDWSAEKESAGYKIDAPVAAKQEAFEKRSDYRDVVLSHFDTGGNLKIQVVGAGSAALEEMMGSFRKFHANPANSKTIEGMPKAGQYVAASFTEDDTFYRARIRHVDRTAQEADVTYIDFGNSEKIPWSRIRPLTQAEFSVERLKPQALDAVWSFINFPFENIYAEMAYEFVYGVTAGKQLVASVDHIRLDGTLEVSIYEPESTVAERSLNFELVEQGLAYVPKKLANQWRAAHPKKIAALEEAQVAAERCHTGMWKYGDNTPDEE